MRDLLKWIYELLFTPQYTDDKMPISIIFLVLFIGALISFSAAVLHTLNEVLGNWLYLSGKVIEKKYTAATHGYSEKYELFVNSDGIFIKVPVPMQEYYNIKENNVVTFKQKIGWIWKKEVNVKYIGKP